MDIDLDLFDDKIKDFLNNKLEEIKSNNGNLRNTLSQREQFFKEEFEDPQMQMDDTSVELHPNFWKKIFNNKFAVGFKIENESGRSVELSNHLLVWNSPNPLLYTVHIYEDEAQIIKAYQNLSSTSKNSVEIKKLATIVVTFEVPQFLDKKSITLSGTLCLTENKKDILLSLPDVEISSADFTNSKYFDWTISRDSRSNLFTITSCSEETRLLVVFPEDWTSSLDTSFEIHCGFVKVNVEENIGCFYFSHKVSHLFDYSLIAVGSPDEEARRLVSIFTRNDDSLISLLHHIHASIPGIIIVPEAYSENYKINNTPFSNKLNGEFKESIKKEIGCVRKFLQELSSQGKNVDRNSVTQFRSKLSTLENNTDGLYVKVSHMNA